MTAIHSAHPNVSTPSNIQQGMPSTTQPGHVPVATNIAGLHPSVPLQTSLKMHPNVMLQTSMAMNASKSTMKPMVSTLSSQQAVPIHHVPPSHQGVATLGDISQNCMPQSSVALSSHQQMSLLTTPSSLSSGVPPRSLSSAPMASSSNPRYPNMSAMLNPQSSMMPVSNMQAMQPSMPVQPQMSVAGQGISQPGQIISPPGGPVISPPGGPVISPPGGPVTSPPAYGMTNIPNVITVNVNGVNCLYTIEVTPTGPKLVPLSNLGNLQNALAPQPASTQAGPAQPPGLARPMAPMQQAPAAMPSTTMSMPPQPAGIQNQLPLPMQQNNALSHPNVVSMLQPGLSAQQGVPGSGNTLTNQSTSSSMSKPVQQQPTLVRQQRIVTIDKVRYVPGPRSLLRPQNTLPIRSPAYELNVQTRPSQPKGVVIYSQSQGENTQSKQLATGLQHQGQPNVEVVDLTASKIQESGIDLSGSRDGAPAVADTSRGRDQDNMDSSQSSVVYDTSRSLSSAANVISKSLNALLNSSQSSISDDDTTTMLANMKKLVKSTATLNTSQASITTEGDDSIGSIVPNSQADSSSGVLPGFTLDTTSDSLPPAIFNATSKGLSKREESETPTSIAKLPISGKADGLDTTNDSLPPGIFSTAGSSGNKPRELDESKSTINMSFTGKADDLDTTDDSAHLAIFNAAYSSSNKASESEVSKGNTSVMNEAGAGNSVETETRERAESDMNQSSDYNLSSDDDEDLPPSLLTPLRQRVNAPPDISPNITADTLVKHPVPAPVSTTTTTCGVSVSNRSSSTSQVTVSSGLPSHVTTPGSSEPKETTEHVHLSFPCESYSEFCLHLSIR